jgi:hypothetical protein
MRFPVAHSRKSSPHSFLHRHRLVGKRKLVSGRLERQSPKGFQGLQLK